MGEAARLGQDDFELAMLTVYFDDQEECNKKFGGIPVHYTMSSERLQKEMWKRHRISKKALLPLFERFFRNQPHPNLDETWPVFVAGGPSGHFKKSNWVEVDGKHYLQIGIRLGQYYQMRKRENANAMPAHPAGEHSGSVR